MPAGAPSGWFGARPHLRYVLGGDGALGGDGGGLGGGLGMPVLSVHALASTQDIIIHN